MKTQFILFTLCFISLSVCSQKTQAPVYLNPSNKIEDRVDDLLSRMTLEEKVGQMTQINISSITKSAGVDELGELKKTVSLDSAKLIELLDNYKIGNFVNGDAVPPAQWYEYIKSLQEVNSKHSRLNIPIIYGMDHVHGANNLAGSTVYPHHINMAATFNPQFVKDEATIIGIETADLGHNWVFAPILGLACNPNWPRFFETYGEDPYLASVLAGEYVIALQNNPDAKPYKQAACAKHFLGYSDPRSGWDRTPALIPDQRLYEFFVPAFMAAIDAGVKTVMINSGEINGVPVHGSYKILTELLRNQLGFKGVAMSDWEDVIRLHTWHKTAESLKEAVYQSVMAGLDVSLTPFDPDFAVYLKELVNEGRIPMERIDLSVKRILTLKFDLGLFDENRFPSNKRFNRINSPENQEKCLNATRESIVLMKNDNTLPVSSDKKILVIGDFAKTKRALAGGWTYVWMATDDSVFPEKMLTLFDALKKEFGNENVDFCDLSNINEKAPAADILLIAIGHEPYSETMGNTTDMMLDEEQTKMAEAALSTGKPTVMVIMEGRPVRLTEIYDKCNSVIWAGLPCFFGGQAISEILNGKVNPSGKLPFSYPAYELHFSPYNRKTTDTLIYSPKLNKRISLADFGHGLSYTSFSYNNLTLSDSVITAGEKIIVKVTVTNSGDRDGKETVLWYITDEYASITRPIKELKHFEKEILNPGSSREFSFLIDPKKDLTFPDEKGNELLEPGTFTIRVGNLSKEFRLIK